MNTEDDKKVVPIRILKLLLLGVVVDSIKVIDSIHDLGDATYDVRERELKGWEGPKVKKYSKAVSDLRKALKDLEGMA